RRRARVDPVEVALDQVEQRGALAGRGLVADVVDEARVPVHVQQVRPVPARQQARGDGEVLPGLKPVAGPAFRGLVPQALADGHGFLRRRRRTEASEYPITE